MECRHEIYLSCEDNIGFKDKPPVSPSKARGEEGHHEPESNSGVAKMSSPHNQLLLSRVAVEAGQEGEAVLIPVQEV